MPWVIIIYSCMVFYADTLSHNWGNAVFAGFNAIVTCWAMICSLRSHRNDFRWFSIRSCVLHGFRLCRRESFFMGSRSS